jgi:hypothetical protein
MSSALAAARKRRINISQNESNVQTPGQQSNTQTSGLTLPQVIALVDKRLITLEQFMKQQSESSNTFSANNNAVPSNIDAIIDEFNARFSILAEEIDNMKNIVLKLQTFTMDVNKTLLDERIRIFSDMDNLDVTKNENVFNLENAKDFPSNIDYLEQNGEFSMSNEFANYKNEHLNEAL